MVKSHIPSKTRFSSLLGWSACALLTTGLVVQAPQPASANWLKQLFEGSSQRDTARIKKKRRETQRRRNQERREALQELKRKRSKTLDHSVPAHPPVVDDDEPVMVLVDLDTQRLRLFKGGIQIATSRVSSGKRGHTTPAGIFSILQKRRHHYSNLYNNAPMPYMQRLTWDGVALHEGFVPNYPASHGCIRMPQAFARKLFGITERGGHVLVTRGEAKVEEIRHAKLFQPSILATIFDPKYLTAATHGADRTVGLDSSADEANAAQLFKGTHKRLVATTEAPDREATKPLLEPLTASTKIRREKLHTYEGRDARPLRILITRRTRRERIIDIQTMLKKLGYDISYPDGKVGRATRKAIVKFQKEKGLKVTGTDSEALWSQLNSATGTWRYATGHLYVRQGFKDLFDAPVTINHPDEPLGTHLYTAMHFKTEATSARWSAVTLNQTRPPRTTDHINDAETLAKANAVTALEALERVEIPDKLRRRIEAMMTPGTSLIITDNGMARAVTSAGTDFIVRTW